MLRVIQFYMGGCRGWHSACSTIDRGHREKRQSNSSEQYLSSRLSVNIVDQPRFSSYSSTGIAFMTALGQQIRMKSSVTPGLDFSC